MSAPLGGRTAVLISVNADAPVLYEVEPGQVLHVGRAPTCDIVLSSPKISAHHLDLFLAPAASGNGAAAALELCARDTSTNGTGVRSCRTAEFEELTHSQQRLLPHGADLLVPFRTVPSRDKKHKVQRMQLTVQYPHTPSLSHLNPKVHRLPDSYDADTGKGRWRYCDRLGEGGLGIVYRAFDMVGNLGTVAIKVSKWSADMAGSRAAQDTWQVFIMHREAQWSLHCLHQTMDARYDRELSGLFVRYLEDHTGFPCYEGPGEFEAVRALYERPELSWSTLTFDPPLPSAPYVVMELAIGLPISRVKPEETLTGPERCLILQHAASSLSYLHRFGLLHRDFRTSNIHLVGRGDFTRIKVLDLGLVIAAEPRHAMNPNLAVAACWHRRQRDYDWVPMEVKAAPHPNFKLPAHSFDAYSLGVLALRLFGGKDWAREVLQVELGSGRFRAKLQERQLEPQGQLLERLLGPARLRPAPVTAAAMLAASCGDSVPFARGRGQEEGPLVLEINKDRSRSPRARPSAPAEAVQMEVVGIPIR